MNTIGKQRKAFTCSGNSVEIEYASELLVGHDRRYSLEFSCCLEPNEFQKCDSVTGRKQLVKTNFRLQLKKETPENGTSNLVEKTETARLTLQA